MRPDMTAPLPDLVLYRREGCGLCDDARALIASVLEDRAAHGLASPTFQEIDITADPELEQAMFDRIPVVELGGRQLVTVVSLAKLRRLIDDAVADTAVRLA
jgi:hypothetical protein